MVFGYEDFVRWIRVRGSGKKKVEDSDFHLLGNLPPLARHFQSLPLLSDLRLIDSNSSAPALENDVEGGGYASCTGSDATPSLISHFRQLRHSAWFGVGRLVPGAFSGFGLGFGVLRIQNSWDFGGAMYKHKKQDHTSSTVPIAVEGGIQRYHLEAEVLGFRV